MENPIKKVSREQIKKIRENLTLAEMITALKAFHFHAMSSVHSCEFCKSVKGYHVVGCPMIQAFTVTNFIVGV